MKFNYIGPNYVFKFPEGGHISFNPMGLSPFGFLFSSDGGQSETALCLNEDYYILNGDWREEYAKAYEEGGVNACGELFLEKEKEHKSSWSDGASLEEWLDARLQNL